MEEETFVGGRSHENAKHLLHRVRELNIDPQSLLWWGFIRHPYDRFLSVWGHLHTERCDAKDFQKGPLWQWHDSSDVNEFVLWLTDSEEGEAALGRVIHLVPQHKFLDPGEDVRLPWFIGRYENLEEDWNKLCDKLRVMRRGLPIRRRSDRSRDWRTALSVDSRARLFFLYEKDFEQFGYVSE